MFLVFDYTRLTRHLMERSVHDHPVLTAVILCYFLIFCVITVNPYYFIGKVIVNTVHGVNTFDGVQGYYYILLYPRVIFVT